MAIESNKLRVSTPFNEFYSIIDMYKTYNNKTRIKLHKQHNVFQQDIESCNKQEIYFYDINHTLIASATSEQFNVPLRYEDEVLDGNVNCLIKVDNLDSCEYCEDGIDVYKYVFLPNIVSRDSLLIDEFVDYSGRVGTITHIDDIGQLHGTWGGLALVPELDEFVVVGDVNTQQ
jgi:hypothetical protein